MAGTLNKKRSIDGKFKRPSKKQKRLQQYNSDSENDNEPTFDAVNLLDSDEDIHTATVDDGAVSDVNGSSDSEDTRSVPRKSKKLSLNTTRSQDDSEAESGESDEDDSGVDDNELEGDTGKPKKKSKRNDPDAFATSLSKILSTKLSTSKRADPVLARSAAAHEASKAAVDNALESKARRQLKEQKKKAMEKGRVKDVLVGTRNEATGELDTSTTEIMETERRLRKVAQRGVVKLFNAVRAAQVKASEAEKSAKKDGVIGINRREEKVNELSKKGFLELIASGGGGLKKGALEEA